MSRTGEYTSTTNMPTSKTKKALGIPETDVIIWTPFFLSPTDNQKAKLYSKAMTIDKDGKYQTAELFYANILRSFFFNNQEEIDEKTEALLTQTEKSEEDLAKELERIARLTERLTTMLTKKKTETEIKTISDQITLLETTLTTTTEKKEIEKMMKEISDLKAQLTILTKA
jgi:hypothetical protein